MKISLLGLTFLFPVLAIAGMSISSCKKHKDTDCPITLSGLAGTYKLTALTYKASPSAPEQDALSTQDACANDDLITLKSDGTYHNDDAGTVCSPNGTGDGTWALMGNTITSDGAISGSVKSFDCSKLVFFISDLNSTGDVLTFTMTKQ
jgi:hypothetical protein